MLQKLPDSVRLRFRFELSLSHFSSELSCLRLSLVNAICPVVRGTLISHLNTATLHGCFFLCVSTTTDSTVALTFIAALKRYSP